MDHNMLNAFVAACVLLLVGAVGFLVKSWMTDVRKSNEKLATAIDKLTGIITGIETAQKLHTYQIGEHTKQLEEHGETLGRIDKEMESFRATHPAGRRVTDICSADDCPFKDRTDPGRATHPGGRLPIPGL